MIKDAGFTGSTLNVLCNGSWFWNVGSGLMGINSGRPEKGRTECKIGTYEWNTFLKGQPGS